MTTKLLSLLLFLPVLAFGQIQYSSTNGFTYANPVYSTSTSIGAPSSSELATAGWVRSLFDGFGVSYYVTTNINNTFTNADIVTTNTAVYEFNTSIPAYNLRTYKVPTNNCYLGQVTTTNRFQQLLAGVVVNSYLEAQNGSGTGGPQVKPEIYISYDKTNWLGDWDAQPQYIPEGATNLISWVVANPTYVSTNANGFYVQRRFKMVAQTSPTPSDVILHLGTNRPSHIALNGDVGTSGNAYLAANQTFTGSNTFYNLTVTSNLTLAGNLNVATLIATNFVGDGSGLTNLIYSGGQAAVNNSSVASSGTYMSIGGGYASTTAAQAHAPISTPGASAIPTNFVFKLGYTASAGTNITLTFYTNSVATPITVTIPSGSTTASDTTHTCAPITNGTSCAIQITHNNGSNPIGTVVMWSWQWLK